PRLVQRLVGVDVSHSREATLVHDRLLHRGARALEPLGEHERRERLLQRLGADAARVGRPPLLIEQPHGAEPAHVAVQEEAAVLQGDRKSTRLNSSHASISYAVFCLKKKKQTLDAWCIAHNSV